MKAILLFIVLIPIGVTCVQSQSQSTTSKQGEQPSTAKPDRFVRLRALEGHWRGEGNGQPGKSSVERSYEFVLKDKYLNAKNVSIYPAQEKNPKGEKHEDWGMFSYDSGRKKLVLRQFHVEGFVNQYVLDRVSDDGKELVFVSEAIENIPKGYRARVTYKLRSADEFEETFEIAEPGKEFQVYSQSRLTRIK